MSISFTGFAHIWLDRHKLELTHFHSFSHNGSFLLFLSHPHWAKDDINDIAYLRGHAVFVPHSRNTTLSQMPVSQSGLYEHWLSSAIRLRVSGSSLQMLRSNPATIFRISSERRILRNAVIAPHLRRQQSTTSRIYLPRSSLTSFTWQPNTRLSAISCLYYLRFICNEGRENVQRWFSHKLQGLNISNFSTSWALSLLSTSVRTNSSVAQNTD